MYFKTSQPLGCGTKAPQFVRMKLYLILTKRMSLFMYSNSTTQVFVNSAKIAVSNFCPK